MWKWIVRFLSVSYLVNRWRFLPPWARAMVAMALVLVLSVAVFGLLGLLRYVSSAAGLGWWGVSGVLVTILAVGVYFWADIPGRQARAKRRKRASRAEHLLDLLPDTRDQEPALTPRLNDAAAVQDRLRVLLRDGQYEETEKLLEAVDPQFGSEPWVQAFRHQIRLRR